MIILPCIHAEVLAARAQAFITFVASETPLRLPPALPNSRFVPRHEKTVMDYVKHILSRTRLEQNVYASKPVRGRKTDI